MSKVYQLVFKDGFEKYCYHIAMSLNKSKLESMIERVKNADEENQRLFNNSYDDFESFEAFHEEIACDNTFPLNNIEDYDWHGYNYSPIEFASDLEIREFDLV